jgi:DNA-binding PadR family transcriptional regulator
MSSTRLLVLGAVRTFQPVHGYLVRRELLRWQVDRWAQLNQGSVYNALRALSRDGYLDAIETERGLTGSARTRYQLTEDGESELERLVRDALWSVDPTSPERLLAGLSFIGTLSRDEVRAALEHRVARIDESPLDPELRSEALLVLDARMRAERGWAEGLARRVRDGAYAFAGEPG